MKVAVVGSRGLSVSKLGDYLPEGTTEIISGGARGVDTTAREYAQANGIKLTEFLPDYKNYPGKVAPLKRNILIIEAADEVIFNDRYYGEHVSGEKYPWCAAFVYCIFEECGASNLFYEGKKTAYCPAIHEWGKKRKLIVPKSEGQYGDIVLFDWNGDGVADHVGFIITRNGNGTYETVEGNTSTYNYTNGGYFLKMTRYYSSIIAIIRPQYDSGEMKGKNMANKKFVIDVSQHQGTINWDKVKNKIDGAIIRCGYGDNLPVQDDTKFARNLSECERLGIPHGIYLYSYATKEAQAKSELAHILRLVKGHKFELPIFVEM